MERSDFVALLRKRIKARREIFMESYNKTLDNNTYHKTIGRVAELDKINNDITEILATTGEKDG